MPHAEFTTSTILNAPQSETRLRATRDTTPAPAPEHVGAHLVRDFKGIVGFHARRHARPWIELDDLKQEGFLGLLEATKRWAEDGGASFETYASMWIRSFVWAAHWRERRRGMTLGRGQCKTGAAREVGASFDAAGDVEAFVDAQPSQEAQLSEAEERAAVREALAALPAHARELVTLWAVDGMTLDEIATRLGVHVCDAKKRNKSARGADTVSTTTIHRFAKKSLATMGEILKAKGFDLGEVNVSVRRAGNFRKRAA